MYIEYNGRVLSRGFCPGGDFVQGDSFYPGGGGLLKQLPRGGHLSINDARYFWNFHYNGRNWRLTTPWGLLIALKFYVFRENYSILD